MHFPEIRGSTVTFSAAARKSNNSSYDTFGLRMLDEEISMKVSIGAWV